MIQILYLKQYKIKFKKNMIKSIIGLGGFGREVFYSLSLDDQKNCVFFVDDELFENQKNYLPLSKFDPNIYEVIVAIGDCETRNIVVEKLPKSTKFFTHIHPSAIILDPDVIIGEGSVICANVVITTNVKIGKHCHLNLSCTIGHDTIIGDFTTISPSANVSGNCSIGSKVFLGTNCSLREKIIISDNVKIGLNAGVIKNISEPGIYVGTPCKKILK